MISYTIIYLDIIIITLVLIRYTHILGKNETMSNF